MARQIWAVAGASLLLAACSAARMQAAETTRPTLLIVLDCVPYSIVQEVAASGRGYFDDLRGPIPLISTFPSTTSVALGGMLEPFGLVKSPGYEARFFDWSRRKVRGGGPVSYFKIEFGWRSFFDLNRMGPAGSFVQALRPVRSGIKRLRRSIRWFAASDRQFYSIYIAATDTAAHVGSPRALTPLLEELDAMLLEARASRPERPFDVVILSDHGIAGGEPLENVRKPLRRALRQAGWRLTRSLRRPNDVVLTPLGLVSSFEVYAQEAQTAELAALVAEVDGVDLCVYEEQWGRRIVSARGDAVFQKRVTETGSEWRYLPLDGDPLEYAELAPASSAGRGAGWASGRRWFDATAGSRYPDALYRLARAFDLVENPASILCSLAPGHMFGPGHVAGMARLAKGRLRWTHGALERQASLGFLMSDAEYWQPPAIARFDRALVPFARALGAADRFPLAEENR